VHPRIALALEAAGWRDARTVSPGVGGLIAALESP
jgi:hypothetical protein